MSSKPIRRSSSASVTESPAAKKPVASVKEAPVGDFVSIQSASVFVDKLEEIANLANEATAADGVAIALLEDDQFLCRASLGFAPEVGVAVEPGQGVCGQCLAESRLVLAQDLSGDVKSALAAPVVIAGKVRGLIAAFSFRTRAFAASHSELLCCLASDIAQGVDAFDSIHIVTRESLEFVPPKDVEPQPISEQERLAILEAVTAPVLPVAMAAHAETIDVSSGALVAPSATIAFESPESGFHFLGYADGSEAVVYDVDEDTTLLRPFRSHWDVVIILAAILIAVLTFGIWLRHRHNQPYTGQLAHQPLSVLACEAGSPTLVPS
jgi:hypothetical protein